MLKADLAIYGSHNAAAVLALDGKIELVMEIERFTNRKNLGIFMYYSANSHEYILGFIADYLFKHYKITKFDTVIAEYLQDKQQDYFPADHYKGAFHHLEHAYGSLYQSPHDQALIFSFDGGGSDGMFNVYKADKSLVEPISMIGRSDLDLGFAYMSFGEFIDDIRVENLWYGNLVYSGKLMGLCAYGKVRDEWLPHFIEYYKKIPEGPTYQQYMVELGEQIGVTIRRGEMEDQVRYDIAATSQRAFEECFLEIAETYLDEYPDLPVHMTGGCALNIILNTRLVEQEKRDVFVSPNPNDCGLAVGMMAHHLKTPIDITYAGLPALDPDMLYQYVEIHAATLVDMEKIVHDLNAGKIIGVFRGRAEHGPRALGNRSILCDPSKEGMKDVLNEKVKHREFYRPFAPVVRLEDVNKYFHWKKESRWMSFCPRVRKKWRERLAAITHVDGTARVQTVTQEQNPWLYRLLTEFDKLTGMGVLLNTSFNSRGRPIASSYSEAMKVYEHEQLDRLVLEDYYLDKDSYYPEEFS